MDRSRCSACGVCDGLLQEMGRTFLCISVPEHRRQCSVCRKHNFLWGISLYSCEIGLNSDCNFHKCHYKASLVSLVLSETGERSFQMRKINLKDVPEQERKSPKGKFGRISKNISIALGREPQSLDL